MDDRFRSGSRRNPPTPLLFEWWRICTALPSWHDSDESGRDSSRNSWADKPGFSTSNRTQRRAFLVGLCFWRSRARNEKGPLDSDLNHRCPEQWWKFKPKSPLSLICILGTNLINNILFSPKIVNIFLNYFETETIVSCKA